jgi:hypothetical protein
VQYENFKPEDRVFPIKYIETAWSKTLKKAEIEISLSR